jgi:hypothetical protein
MYIPVGASSLAPTVILAGGVGLPLCASPTDKPVTVQRSGSQPSTKGSPEGSTGSVRVDSMLRETERSRMSGGLVTFEPEARTAWHTHPLGQTLIVTAGAGRVQRWGGPVQEITPATWCASRPARSTGTGPVPPPA